MRWSLLAVCLSALAGFASQGCSSMAPAGPQARTEAGVVQMDWRSRCRLDLSEHSFHRDSLGHLVVAVGLKNTSDKPYYVQFCVDFRDGVGAYERRAHQTDVEKLPPGLTPLEWTSDNGDAKAYVVKISSARFWQW